MMDELQINPAINNEPSVPLMDTALPSSAAQIDQSTIVTEKRSRLPRPRLIILLLILLLVFPAFYWTVYSGAYVAKLVFMASKNCPDLDCGGLLGLGWIKYLSFYHILTLFTFGLPGLIRPLFYYLEFSVAQFIYDYLGSFSPILSIIPTAYQITIMTLVGFVSLSIPYLLTGFVSLRKFSAKTNLIMFAIYVGVLSVIGLSTFVIDKQIYESPYSDRFVAKGRDAQRRSDLYALTKAMAFYIETSGQIPPQLTATPVDVASDQFDICPLIIPKYIACIPQDSLVVDQKSVCSCAEPYETNYQLSFDPHTQTVIGFAPQAESTEIQVERKLFVPSPTRALTPTSGPFISKSEAERAATKNQIYADLFTKSLEIQQFPEVLELYSPSAERPYWIFGVRVVKISQAGKLPKTITDESVLDDRIVIDGYTGQFLCARSEKPECAKY